IGYNFIHPSYLPAGRDEYHLRNFQNRNGILYRNLSAYEIEVLVRNRNTSDDWNKIQVSDAFNPELVKNCKFFGLVRIGKLESIALEYHNIVMPVGLYDSTIISCDFGDNVVINNVNFMSHYIVGNEVMIANVHELHATDHSKFGNGIIKEGESEEVRIWMEVCNENGGRKILPFNGMQPGDAYLWSKYRDDETVMQKFMEFTEKKFDKQRGYYGKIGDHSVIKNTAIVKDVWVGPNAYIKGANKLKNLTVNSSVEAAGATIGSNHNSRAADGEIVTARGFWPGLCVSLKHNSKFASFTLIAKGDYPAELNIQLPFSLINNDVANNKLVVMPAYWFLYNLYALARNSAKYVDRDKRTKKIQQIEYDYLAPDSVNEIFTALDLLRKFTAKAVNKNAVETNALVSEGEQILNDDSFDFSGIEVYADDFECANRKTQIVKVKEAYLVFKELVVYYAVQQLMLCIQEHNVASFDELLQLLPESTERTAWINIGGQLVSKTAVDNLLSDIRGGAVKNWNDVHQFYQQNGKTYKEQKLRHAFACLLELLKIEKRNFTTGVFSTLLQQALLTKTWMTENIYDSRAKDYQNEFRKMIYDNDAEMENVIGKLEDNVFIHQQKEELQQFKLQLETIRSKFGLS
ncbi:MAG: DUF4954 family protein, partial [Chitinophagaceae bacterium]